MPRDYPRPQLAFDDILETIQTKIKLRVHRSVMDRVLDCCASEDISSDGDEHYIVRFPFVENEYYYDILLSYGDKCECLEPSNVREELRQRIRNVLSLYEN